MASSGESASNCFDNSSTSDPGSRGQRVFVGLLPKKLKGATIIRAAAAHNKRTIPARLGVAGSIDATRTYLNECLAGPSSPTDVAAQARALMDAACVCTLRKDAVRAIEFVVSLTPSHGIDERAFFAASVAWMGAHFGGSDNILSADIHRDEAAPHVHVLLLPLIAGRMVGSDALGGPARFAAMHRDFHMKVAAPYGLERPPARLRGGAKAAGVSAVLQQLKQAADAATRSAVWGVIRDCIERDPGPFMAGLGIAAPEGKPKALHSMTAIFISKGKGSAIADAEQPYRVRREVNE